MASETAATRPRPWHRRGAVTATAMALVVVSCVVYLVVLATSQAAPATAAAPGGPGGGVTIIDLSSPQGEVSVVGGASPDEPRAPIGMRCQRYYAAAGTSVCLRLAGVGPTFEAVVRTAGGAVARTVALPGTPSRARVSASGRLVAWTVFVTGHSYSDPGGFSTQAGVLDLESGTLVDSLENFTTLVEGMPYTAADRNFWGITFAADDQTFYATMGTAGQRWLVRGDLTTRTVEALHKGVECPSLSPDGRRIAFKAPTVLQGRWKLGVLEVDTGEQSVIEGTDGIDDQAVWLDDRTLAYGVPSAPGGPTIVRVPADGSAPPRTWITQAASLVPSAP